MCKESGQFGKIKSGNKCLCPNFLIENEVDGTEHHGNIPVNHQSKFKSRDMHSLPPALDEMMVSVRATN